MSDHVQNTSHPNTANEPSQATPAAAVERPLADLTARLNALVRLYSADDKTPTSNTTTGHSAEPRASSAQVTKPTAIETGASPRCSSIVAGPAYGSPIGHSRRDPSEDAKKARIMIVDDEEVNILTLQRYLTLEGYQEFVVTTQPRNAMDLLRQRVPDVLILDIHMPEVTGLDILLVKQQDPSLGHIPVIVLTASTDPGTKRKALDLGAHDFLAKPLEPNDLIPRVKNAVIAKRHYDQKAQQAVELEQLVRSRTAELEQSRHELVMSLARAAEHRDNETGHHVLRVGRYAAMIAQELGWSEPDIEMLELAAQLHDVGKIGVPDSIIFKPGKLDAQEYEIIKKHCAWGMEIIEPLSEQESRVFRSHTQLGDSMLLRGSATLTMASRIAQTHHENWDGTGYPMGLSAEDIPIEGRITAIADVYDALSSQRPYKKPFPREKCFEVMTELRGKKFDPQLLDCFFRRASEIVAVQLKLMDRSAFCGATTK